MARRRRKKKGVFEELVGKPIKIHRTAPHVRYRIRAPGKFDPRSFRTIDPGRPGRTKLVIGCPKGSYDVLRGLCRTGTRVQSVLKERR